MSTSIISAHQHQFTELRHLAPVGAQAGDQLLELRLISGTQRHLPGSAGDPNPRQLIGLTGSRLHWGGVVTMEPFGSPASTSHGSTMAL